MDNENLPMGDVLLGEQDIDVADLPDSLTETHYHPGPFQLVQETLAGLVTSGERRRYLHDREAEKQNLSDAEFQQLVHILEKSKFFKSYVGQRKKQKVTALLSR